jgi:glutamine amidotransferase
MCRHFAYIGEQVAIRTMLLDPPHSLAEQAWAPRRQRHGTMNVDGFGVGWYADSDPVPARYRRTGPIWADDALPDLARVTRTHAMLCAVRSASVGTDGGASAAAPYAEGQWLFSLNGALVGWSAAAGRSATGRRRTKAMACAEAAGESITEPHPAAAAPADAAAAAVLRLAERLPAADLLRLQASCDTALIWALVLARLRDGEGQAQALAGTVGDIRAAGATGRFNLLLTDGKLIAATAAGDSLCYRHRSTGVVVASEPSDDDPDWQEVPDGSVLEATRAQVRVQPLAASGRTAGQVTASAEADRVQHVHSNGEATRP